MDMEGVTFNIISNDNHLIGPLANTDKIKNPQLPTASRLDGDKILYSPEKLDKMDVDGPPQILGEIVHLALMHPDRKKAVTTGIEELSPLFDVAADLATYHCITESKKFIRPEDLKFPEGLSSEEYFQLLADEAQAKDIDLGGIMGEAMGEEFGKGQGQGKEGDQEGKEGQGQGQGEGQPKDQGSAAASAYNKLLEKLGVKGKHKQDHSQWGDVPLSTQHSAKAVFIDAMKGRGDLPAGLQRLMAQLEGEAKVRWQERLRRMVGSYIAATKKRYTMTRPSRRFGVPHPGTKRIKRPGIGTHVDTSGSMDDLDTGIAIREVKAIADAYGAPFYLWMGDAELQVISKVLTKSDIDQISIKGGGGTDHRPLFQHIEDKKIKLDLLVCFTDMATCWPEKPPRCKTIIVTCTRDQQPPWPGAEVLYIDKAEAAGGKRQ